MQYINIGMGNYKWNQKNPELIPLRSQLCLAQLIQEKILSQCPNENSLYL